MPRIFVAYVALSVRAAAAGNEERCRVVKRCSLVVSVIRWAAGGTARTCLMVMPHWHISRCASSSAALRPWRLRLRDFCVATRADALLHGAVCNRLCIVR